MSYAPGEATVEGLFIIDFLGEARLAGRRPRRETDRLIWAEGELP